MNFVKNTIFKACQHVNFYIIPLFLISLLLLSLDYILCIIAHVAFLFYIFARIRRRYTIKNFYKTIVTISICNLITFHIMPAAYAELLPWEVGLHIYLYLSSFYYYYCYKENYNKNDKTLLDECKNQKEKSITYIRFQIYLLLASLYSTQLTFTTICTPIMIFDWFLIVKDCSLIYSTWFSSVCAVSGFFTLNASLMILLKLFKLIKAS